MTADDPNSELITAKTKKPDCLKCKYRRQLPGDEHSACDAPNPRVTGHPYSVRMGWFMHPINFDPTWLRSCDSFEAKQ